MSDGWPDGAGPVEAWRTLMGVQQRVSRLEDRVAELDKALVVLRSNVESVQRDIAEAAALLDGRVQRIERILIAAVGTVVGTMVVAAVMLLITGEIGPPT